MECGRKLFVFLFVFFPLPYNKQICDCNGSVPLVPIAQKSHSFSGSVFTYFFVVPAHLKVF